MVALAIDDTGCMDCLENYRGELIGGLNRNLEAILQAPDETAIHDFRVGIKRVTALYEFLQAVDANFDAAAVLARYRGLFKACGRLRDLQIARNLLVATDGRTATGLLDPIDAKIAELHAAVVESAEAEAITGIDLPTIAASGVAEAAIMQRRDGVLAALRRRVLDAGKAMTTRRWHRKRIRLKRYRHTLDAFQYCPGHDAELAEIARIQQLEQLLGDWHDRVVASELLKSIAAAAPAATTLALALADQAQVLLDGAQNHLDELRRWYAINAPD